MKRRRNPRVFISYSHDSEDHKDNVLNLAQSLRAAGVDVHLDRFVESSPPHSWPDWMHNEIRRADYVVCVCTETYKRRAEGIQSHDSGTGTRWEAMIITGELYRLTGNHESKFVPTIVDTEDLAYIPYFLRDTTRYVVGRPGIRNLEQLIRRLTRQPEVVAGPLGSVPVFGTRHEQGPFETGEIARSSSVLGQARLRLAVGSIMVLAAVGGSAFWGYRSLSGGNAADIETIVEANGKSERPVLSGDGRFVAFRSDATNLVPEDNNATRDVFVFDRETKSIEQINLSHAGENVPAEVESISISADGRMVAFDSFSSILVEGDTNRRADIFLHDRSSGLIERVSVGSSGEEGDEGSAMPVLSGDGQLVLFTSGASTLVDGDSNGFEDVFLRDRRTGVTERISRGLRGEEPNAGSIGWDMSDDGRYVAFFSGASNLVDNDTNGLQDVFVYDRVLGTTERVSVSSEGTEANADNYFPILNDDGSLVAFYSEASNLSPTDPDGSPDIDLYVHDRRSGKTEHISRAEPVPITDTRNYGRPFLVPWACSDEYTPEDTNNNVDTCLYNARTGSIDLVSVDSNEVPSNGHSYPGSSISDDGRYVAFYSLASNLVPDDKNGHADVFLRDLVLGTTERVSARRE